MSQSTARSLGLLSRIASSDHPLALMELARTTGLDKSTVSRLLDHLVRNEFVVRDVATRRFTVGPALLALSVAALERSDLRAVSARYLVLLRHLSSQTASLHIRAGDFRVCIDAVEGDETAPSDATVGASAPIYNGAPSRVILAHLPRTEVGRIARLAAEAGEDIHRLPRALADIRERGFETGGTTSDRDVVTLAAPVFRFDGIAGAISLSGSAASRGGMTLARLAPTLVRTAACISGALRTAGALPADRTRGGRSGSLVPEEALGGLDMQSYAQ